MKGKKYFSEVVDISQFDCSKLNIITAPVGSGKSYWALNELAKTASKLNIFREALRFKWRRNIQ